MGHIYSSYKQEHVCWAPWLAWTALVPVAAAAPAGSSSGVLGFWAMGMLLHVEGWTYVFISLEYIYM